MNLYSFYSLHLFASLCNPITCHQFISIHMNSLCQAAGTLKCITLDSPGASWRCLLSRVSTVRPWSQAFVSTKRGFKVNSIHVAPKTPWPCCILLYQKAAKTCLKRNRRNSRCPKTPKRSAQKDGRWWKMMEVVVVKTFGNGQVAAAQNTAHMKIQRQEIIIAALPKKCFEARRHLPW